MLKHKFCKNCYDIDYLLDDTVLLGTFIRKLNSQSKLNPHHIEPQIYMGDGFEVFVESFIAQFGTNREIYIGGYAPIKGKDLGIDGLGARPNGDVVTVQAKARSDATVTLTTKDDQISNFVAHSKTKHKAKPKNMYIFTSAADVSRTANEIWDHEVRVINNRTIRNYVDNNEFFWMNFKAAMLDKQING